jgi:hypothetical protein
MIAPLAKFIDWSVLQAGYAMLSLSMLRESTNERDLKLEQAAQRSVRAARKTKFND